MNKTLKLILDLRVIYRRKIPDVKILDKVITVKEQEFAHAQISIILVMIHLTSSQTHD
ncbi:hypothetical protein [Sodalis endosymbiont of Henestaris halophilus]|nr:hypothetical protein HBA_0783 [Sodalis endosymbiont of Henestaris halophilus]